VEEPAVSFEQVSKTYSRTPVPDSLREAISSLPLHLLGRRNGRESQGVRALEDVSFRVHKGQVQGIIGPNGAGKSTILKLLAGITRPTRGVVEVRGRVASLIELGAGFHPDLTGRENVFLNGQIMGLSRREIATRYRDIVEFAELDEFMDVQVKRFSSGMYARLGFAVAAHLDPDVMLVDEVLSVGDAAFQRKSQERMLAMVKSGKAVVFVSHNLIAVERMCDQVMWLAQGRMQSQGRARETIEAYLTCEENQFVDQQLTSLQAPAGLCIRKVQLLDRESRAAPQFAGGEDISVSIEYRADRDLKGARFGIGVAGAKGLVFVANMLVDGTSVNIPAGSGSVHCRLKNVPLMPGAYQLFGEVWGAEGYDVLVRWSEWARFRIVRADPSVLRLGKDYSVSHVQADAPVMVPYDWDIQ
jgi:lipopolysaccharide transport system ATP-binding protein